MILKNPTDQDISVQIFGKNYKVSAMGEVSLSSEAGNYWKKHIHAFMEIISEGGENSGVTAKVEVVEEEKPSLDTEMDKNTGEEIFHVKRTRKSLKK